MKKTSKPVFVIDTNVLVSAFILPRSIARRALDKVLDEGVLVFSRSTVMEFTEVLLRKKFDKYNSVTSRLDNINDLMSFARIIDVSTKISASRDKKDDQFLELAVAANATCIISGDKDLLVLHPFRDIQIMSAGDFMNFQTNNEQ